MNKCEHNKQKCYCKICKGACICLHNRQRSLCKDCKGASICIHDRIKSSCKDCKGNSICIHNKRKTRCKDCQGGSICLHDKIRSSCRICNSSLYCSLFCKHNKEKRRCKECGGSALCKSEWCEKKAIKKYNNYCLTCCINLFPDIKVCRNYKTKEKAVVDIIQNEFKLDWIWDKRIENDCYKNRPDLRVDLESHILIIEVDENKHNNYDCSCENKRLMEISKDLNHKNIVMIRFNPDSYINQNGIKVTSCWKMNKLGVLTIPKTKEKEWNERIKCLLNQIEYWLENQSDKMIEVIELYY
jgi:hypothetical protein